MEDAVREAIARLHAAESKAVLYVTGGGSTAVSWLLTVPGASRTVVEAVVPYARESVLSLLGFEPEHFTSRDTARALALRAFDRAVDLGVDPGQAVGVGAAAALVTDRPRMGDHQVFAAVETGRVSYTASVKLKKEKRSREEEEELAARLVLRTLCRALRVPEKIDLGLSGERRTDWFADQVDPWIRLACGATPCLLLRQDGAVAEEAPALGFLLSGSFNPLHQGHLRLFEAAQGMLPGAGPGAFEISVANVDKPMLSPGSARKRAQAVASHGPVVVTREATFPGKARLFPRASFVVGMDTARRVLDPKYYRPEEGDLGAVLSGLRGSGTRFLVAGRVSAGRFETLRDLAVPASFHDLFLEIPETVFREDISSTELRSRFQP